MGSNEDIMHEFVLKELKRLYPIVDGWQIKKAKSTGKEQGFIISRRLSGKIESAVTLVSFDQKVSRGTVDSLKAMAQDKPFGAANNPRLILIVPRGTDSTEAGGEVEVLPMQSFGFRDKELIWLKRRFQMDEKVASGGA
ncbi:MAG: hypothetical protein LUQ01_04475 [Methanolinea sp.]|nr:hypothetical protein [Methanolinea sp.]